MKAEVRVIGKKDGVMTLAIKNKSMKWWTHLTESLRAARLYSQEKTQVTQSALIANQSQ